jgi:hypothetical protein
MRFRLWADYINNAQYLYDDANVHGGIDDDQRFIILADLNADPLDGDSFVLGGVRAINQLRIIRGSIRHSIHRARVAHSRASSRVARTTLI